MPFLNAQEFPQVKNLQQLLMIALYLYFIGRGWSNNKGEKLLAKKHVQAI